MTAARDDDFMALPAMEANSTDTYHARERLADDTVPVSANTSSDSSSKSALECKVGDLFNTQIDSRGDADTAKS